VKPHRRGVNVSQTHRTAVDIGPSYSTFPSKVTGDCAAATLYQGPSAPIGRLVGDSIDPKNFLKKKTGGGGGPQGERLMLSSSAVQMAALAASSSRVNAGALDAPGAHGGNPAFSQYPERMHDGPRKPPIPDRRDKPVMGLHTDKNFVHSNAVEVQCSPPRRLLRDEPRPTEHKDFAKVPAYLNTRKAEMAAEQQAVDDYKTMRRDDAAAQKAQYVRQMAEDEREYLSRGLRKAWADKYRAYQALPFAKDTALQISRKESLERELKEIEADLEKLERPVLFVHRDDTVGVTQYARAEATREAERTAKRLVKEAVEKTCKK
jgi:pimeloyl-ACP methyl ester carboxylesterase